MSWIATKDKLPPENIFVETKVHDKYGERNKQDLKLMKKLWFSKDNMYVYYTPTHWKYKHGFANFT